MGSFYVSHAAARIFREQESGSFVHFTSTSGLVGNFGQANYSAAKMGIVGLSRSIALDMAASPYPLAGEPRGTRFAAEGLAPPFV